MPKPPSNAGPTPPPDPVHPERRSIISPPPTDDPPRPDAGSVTVEAAIVVVFFALLIGLIVAFGRITMAGSGVDAAAKAAAREVSISRTPYDALPDAEAAARDTLQQRGLHCTAIDVAIDTSHITAAPGQTGYVTATVTCTVDLSDVSIPGMPGTKQMSATFTSPVDKYRQTTVTTAYLRPGTAAGRPQPGAVA